jgi:hypothetical protein
LQKIKAVATKKSDGVSASLDGPSIDFPWRGLNFKFSGNTAKNLLSGTQIRSFLTFFTRDKFVEQMVKLNFFVISNAINP